MLVIHKHWWNTYIFHFSIKSLSGVTVVEIYLYQEALLVVVVEVMVEGED